MNSMSGFTGNRGATGSNSGRSNSGSLQGGGGIQEKIPSGYKKSQLPNFTPEMMEMFQRMISELGPDSFLAKLAGGDQSMFDQMEAPAMRQFSELQGGLASRFSGMGMGGKKSSGFQNTMNSAASNFAQDLQSKRLDYQRNAANDLAGYSNQLLQQRPYENKLVQKDQNQSSGWGGLIGAGLGGLAGFLSPMPGGLMAGANVGYQVGSGF